MNPSEVIGVLVMAYGGPRSLEEVEPYLWDVRGGRPPSPPLVEEVRRRYQAIGGGSPLLEITSRQAAALEAELNRLGPSCFRAYVGMRHWEPRIRAALERMKADGVRLGIGLPMAPHFSRLSVGAYVERAEEARRELQADFPMRYIQGFHRHPGFLEAVAEKVKEALGRFPAPEAVKVIFTAHSLPQELLEEDDPYAQQVQESAAGVARRLGLPSERWVQVYQSAGARPGDWLGPQLVEVIPELVRAGERALLVVPIGFVADHVEVLYDIDIEARQVAQAYGARLERTASLNDSPTFIRSLAEMVREVVG